MSLSPGYCRRADGVFVVYDISERDSFDELETRWEEAIFADCPEESSKILIGNKCDLVAEREVEYQQGKDFADCLGMDFIEISVKENINVDEAFKLLILKMVERAKNDEQKKISKLLRNRFFLF